MRRLLLAAVPLAILFGAAACGDGADEDPGVEPTATVFATPTTGSNEQPQVPDTPVAQPTPIPDHLPIIQVAFAGKVYAPLRSEFLALPKEKITVGGKTYEGVSLATLGEKAGARAGAIATINGTRMDNLRLGAVRFTLTEIGASTVFVMDDTGRITLASSTIPTDQWLKDITGIGLN